ncbi:MULTISPECIES: hypothetical protein [unclassified Bartonella]|uniref:hypothetical protein n=1 Tax=unclassified Bartonella TaxID=2645622 RepID=UPI0035D0F1A7
MLCRDHDNPCIGQINALQIQAALSSAFMSSQATIIKGIRNKLADAWTHTACLTKEDAALSRNSGIIAQQEFQH